MLFVSWTFMSSLPVGLAVHWVVRLMRSVNMYMSTVWWLIQECICQSYYVAEWSPASSDIWRSLDREFWSDYIGVALGLQGAGWSLIQCGQYAAEIWACWSLVLCIRGWIRDTELSRELSLLGTYTVWLLLDYDCVLSKQSLELAGFS